MKKKYAQAEIVKTNLPGGGYLVTIAEPTRDPELQAENANIVDETQEAFTTLNHARNYVGTLARKHDPTIQRIRLTPQDWGWTYRWELTN